MDPRQRSRFVSNPAIRHVGFFAPGNPAPNQPDIDPVLDSDSPSPVIIPPRFLDASTTKSLPVRVPSPPPSKQDLHLPGAYNPPDSILDSSPLSSPLSSDTHDIDISSDGTDLLRPNVSIVTSAVRKINLNHHLAPVSAHQVKQSEQVSSSLKQPQAKQGSSSKTAQPSLQDDTNSVKPLKDRTTKAERRAKQEAEREAKQASRESGETVATDGGNKQFKPQNEVKEVTVQKKSMVSIEKISSKERKTEIPAPRMQFDDNQRVAKAKKKSLIDQIESKNRVELFRHLPQFVHGAQLPSLEAKFFHNDTTRLHSSIYQVGIQYLTGDIVGGNARCIAMLLAFRELIKDYTTPEEKTFSRDLTARLNSNVSFLNTCRPLSISMGNAIRFLKLRIAKLPVNLSETECKTQLISDIDHFIHEKITIADNEIAKYAVMKIKDGDVVLTYAHSSIVEMVILHAFELGLKFRVIIVDSRPKLEAKMLLKRLLARGVSCTYAHVNAISYVMQEATKVFLGASSILSNGTVYSRVGSASVAMVAQAFHIPVLICCETYKFHERVQLDSICFNELGDPNAIVEIPGREDMKELDAWAQNPHLTLLNLTYDLMPAEYVSVIVTELGMVPATSVAVILREHRKNTII